MARKWAIHNLNAAVYSLAQSHASTRHFSRSSRRPCWRAGGFRALDGRDTFLQPEAQDKARELLSLGELVSAPYDYSRDPADFADLRRQIAKLITDEHGLK